MREQKSREAAEKNEKKPGRTYRLQNIVIKTKEVTRSKFVAFALTQQLSKFSNPFNIKHSCRKRNVSVVFGSSSNTLSLSVRLQFAACFMLQIQSEHKNNKDKIK